MTNTMEQLFGHLQTYANKKDNYILANNNEIYIVVKDNKIICNPMFKEHETLGFELDRKTCQDKNELLKTLKEAGLLHKETIDILTWTAINKKDDCIMLYGCVERDNKNINITWQSGGRGTTVALIKDISEDQIENALNAKGINVRSYEVLKETSKGTLILAKVAPWDTKKAFLLKDGKVKNASVVTLCNIIKEL